MIGRFFTPPEEETAEPKGFDDFELLLGDIMRGERATMGKSLLDVQRELKIKATYIAAIENTDPTAFDTPGFIAGYVRSYARYLGLDPEWAYKTFCEEGNFETAHGMSAQASSIKPVVERTSSERRDPLSDPNASFVPRGEAVWSRIEPGAIGSVLVLMALIGGIGYGGWSVLQEVQRVQLAPVDQAPGVTASIDPLADAGLATPAPGQMDQTAGFTAPGPDGFDRLYRPEALEVPVLVARDGPISSVDPRSVGTLVENSEERLVTLAAPDDLPAMPEALATADATPPVQVLAADAPDVVVFATQPAWVRISAADGSVIFEKILDAGEEYVLPKTEEPPLLRTGYAGAVYFAVNGQAYGPAGEGASVVKDIAMGQAELKEAYALADLTANPVLAKVVAELTLSPDAD